jgi:hypothetical protein
MEIPLIMKEAVAFDDDFTANAGAAQNRLAGASALHWKLTGSGFTDAVVAGGYMTSDKNTYYCVAGMPGISEVGVIVRGMATPFLATVAISPSSPFDTNIFNGMWHTNWYYDGPHYSSASVDSKYWNVGDTISTGASTPSYRFLHITPFELEAGRPYELVEKVRGSWLFGYLDGALAFVQLADKIGELAGNGHGQSIFVQNHTLSGSEGTGGNGDTLGGERQERVWVKVQA